jgi:hypothetical protein
VVREAFRAWLEAEPLQQNTRGNQWSQARRLEGRFGDLDAAFDADGFAEIRGLLAYSRDDEREGSANPSGLEIDGDIYSNLASYRATLRYYEKFRQHEGRGGGVQIHRAELERLKAAFLARYPDFPSLGFQAREGGYWDEERRYKDELLSHIERATREDLVGWKGGAAGLGEFLLRVLREPPANFIGWRSFQLIDELSSERRGEAYAALGELARSQEAAPTAAAVCARRLHGILSTGTGGAAADGTVRTIVTTVLSFLRPSEAVAVKTRYIQRVYRGLTSKTLFRSPVLTEAEYGQLVSLCEEVERVMRDEWGWSPRDLWDVQGFFWATSADQNGEDGAAASMDASSPAGEIVTPRPTNLILYGPPGTGKTYETAERAVRLCDGEVVQERGALMARYRELLARKRIAFVTFHQSYAYEDFVEGLRPETGGGDAEDEEATSAGFSLRARPGIFRQVAELARDNRGHVPETASIDRTSRVFKMSLGRYWHAEGARLYAEAMEGGFVALGWGGDIDWSEERYADFGEVKARWREDHPEASGNDPNVQMTYTLRSAMREGDLVVISQGNKRFRAIGRVTGPYEFVRSERDEYHHRRPVRWLWRNDEGAARELIYRKNFMMQSVYELNPAEIEWPALEQLVAGANSDARSGAPEPFVLVIDEINRANISKVFGELITLIEPDKRLGCENALTVTLPYSGDTFGVPANLHIIGTMNTADRSIALLDTALRRRFEFEELMPRPELLQEASQACGVDLVRALAGLNARIESLFDREHQVGHAFFMSCRTLADVNRSMRSRIIPLLAEYFYEDWEKVRQVMGETRNDGVFVERSPLPPLPGSERFETDERWRYSVRDGWRAEDYEQLFA